MIASATVGGGLSSSFSCRLGRAHASYTSQPKGPKGRVHALWGAGQGNLSSQSGFERASDRVFSGRLQLGLTLPRWGGYLAYGRTVDTNDENRNNPPRSGAGGSNRDVEAGVSGAAGSN